MNISALKEKLLNSRLFKDSFWAVAGNGIGNAMLLLAGILIARLLGKDVYGEYGLVKSTMFYIASFATFGLGLTSTRYIARYASEHTEYIRSLMRDAILITVGFSFFIALLLVLFSNQLAEYVGAPTLSTAFQFLAGIIVCKAITTTQIGLLAGFKAFKKNARNSLLSGSFMLVTCVPLTYFWGLKGSLLALMCSQAFNAVLNLLTIRYIAGSLPAQERKSFKKELISFSFPIALQESSYTVCHWAGIMFLTKFSSTGELGLYSASAQWNAIILMVPSLLHNVVLSYLASSIGDKRKHDNTVKLMLGVNFCCSFIPFVIVFIFADFIASFYGSTFSSLPDVLRVLTFYTIFESCTSVFRSELMAQGRTWLLFSIRFLRDLIFVSGVYIILQMNNGMSGAISYAWISVGTGATYFVVMALTYLVINKKKKI